MAGRRVFPFDGREVGAAGQRSVSAESVLTTALPSANDALFGPSSRLSYTNLNGSQVYNPLAQQLQVVARTIAARSTLGMRRQIFYVSWGGFDTHDTQNSRHADLLLRLDHAMAYFNDVLQSMGMRDQVLTFTSSEFGRSFTSNGDGTDHGWGGHQFVMGGGLKGAQLYGQMPVLARRNLSNNSFDDSTHQIASGVLIPTTSVDQLAYSVGRWMGVSHSHLAGVLPNLSNFNSPQSVLTCWPPQVIAPCKRAQIRALQIPVREQILRAWHAPGLGLCLAALAETGAPKCRQSPAPAGLPA